MSLGDTLEASPKSEHGGRWGNSAGGRLLAAQPDRLLCALALRGHAGAYDTLYERYRAQIFAFVFHLLGGNAPEDAEDITQETFSAAFRRLTDRRTEGSFRCWLYTIARNRSFDHIRARKPEAAELDGAALVDGTDGDSRVEAREQVAWLVGAMSQLPARQRQALVMHELAGMRHHEIAQQLDTSVTAVKKLVSRARDTLAEAAGDSGYRPRRRLKSQLKLITPMLSLAAGGTGITTALAVGGLTGGSAATAGGFTIGSKVAASAIAAAMVGGGTGAVAPQHGQQNAHTRGVVSGHSKNDSGRREASALRRADRRAVSDRGSRDSHTSQRAVTRRTKASVPSPFERRAARDGRRDRTSPVRLRITP
jgi:RNA polymerase sigma factor (sigma-70 family)